jgi:lysophospholipase L1-like esterase
MTHSGHRLLLAALLMLSVASTALAEPLRYVAIGDSITAHRDDGAVLSYVDQLEAEIATLPFSEIVNVARAGYTTADVLKVWSGLVAPSLPAHVVSIMLGRNDALWDLGQPRPRVPLPDFLANMTKIIARLRAVPHRRGGTFNGGAPDIVVLAPPYVRTSNSMTGKGSSQPRHEIYVAALRALCARLDVRFLDINELTGRWIDWDPLLWSTVEWTLNHDGTHPTTAVHAMMLPYIREAITAGAR